MLKVLLVIPTLDRSGAEKQFALLAAGLPRDRFEVRVVTLTRSGPYTEMLAAAGIPVTLLHKRWKFDPFALRRLSRIIREFDPDIVHGWLFAANSYVRLVRRSGRRPRVVISERCVDTWKAGWQTWLDRKLASRTDALVANSEAVADFYSELGHQRERINVIRNGVATPQPMTPEREAELRREWDVPADGKLIAFVGRLARQKRPLDLIWSLQLLRQVHEKVYLVVIGDGPLRDKMEQTAEHFYCRPMLRFAGHREDAASLLPMFRVFWLLSEFEGQSNSLMEAMAAGVVPVVSDIPPNRELVTDGAEGYVVPIGDCQAVSGWTDRILADDALHRRLAEAATTKMRERFAIGDMIDGHIALYESLARDAEEV